MKNLRKLLADAQARLMEIHDEVEAIGQVAADEGRELTDEENTQLETLAKEFEQRDTTAKNLEKQIAAFDQKQAQKLQQAQLQGAAEAGAGTAIADPRDLQATNSLSLRVRHQRSKVFANTFDAYCVGQWLGGAMGNARMRQWSLDHGFAYTNAQGDDYYNAMGGGTPSAGGYLVPTILAEEIIRLVEEYGVARRFMRNAVMTSDKLDVPKRASGLSVGYPGEGNPISPSDVVFDQVNLVAVKYAQLAVYSSELAEDSVISMADLLTTEMAWGFAQAEDTNGFLGDGSATYGGITGIANALQAGSQVQGGAGLWDGVGLDDLEQMVGLVPQYGGLNPRWYMNSFAYFTTVVSLLNAAGGTDMRQIEAGGELMLLGYPVTFTQVLPGKNGANGDLGIVFGDLNLGSYIGVRRDVFIRLLDQVYAVNDQLAIVGTMRGDIQVHDVGDATDAGCIVGLYLNT